MHMEFTIHINDKPYKIENIKFQKMMFIYNALEEGWTVHKKKDSFIFTKSHEGKKEILSESYLLEFMKENMDINKILA